MAGNSFGQLFRITTYGESHGAGIGVVIDGCPSGLEVDIDFIASELQRRKPGQSAIVTQRKENEAFSILSGTFEGKTTGTPLTIFIPNSDQRSKDYSHIESTYRPSHADMTYEVKYGHRDHRGGGRSSARETAARVAAGAIAKLILKRLESSMDVAQLDWSQVEKNIVRCPDAVKAAEMELLIRATKKQGNTIGGRITGYVTGMPVGLGEPVFDKLHADLGKAMLSINAVKGFEYGSGFSSIAMTGSEHNDEWLIEDGVSKTTSNHSGGVQGGISNGMPIYFNVAFKPVATIMTDQKTINKDGENVIATGKGRHDPCVVPRAVPIVEAMTALVLVDHYLRDKAVRL